MKKTLQNIQKTAQVKPIIEAKALNLKGGKYIPPRRIRKPGNNT